MPSHFGIPAFDIMCSVICIIRWKNNGKRKPHIVPINKIGSDTLWIYYEYYNMDICEYKTSVTHYILYDEKFVSFRMGY